MAIPRIGRTVIVLGIESNGTDRAPAVITRNWGGERDTREGHILVNLTIFPDCASPRTVGSVHLFETEEEAQAYRDSNMGSPAAYWPRRD